jgi:hypothetical protein
MQRVRSLIHPGVPEAKANEQLPPFASVGQYTADQKCYFLRMKNKIYLRNYILFKDKGYKDGTSNTKH